MNNPPPPPPNWPQGAPPNLPVAIRDGRVYDAASLVAVSLGVAGVAAEQSVQREEPSSSTGRKFVSEEKVDRLLPDIPTLQVPGETTHPYPHYAAFAHYQPLLANVLPVVRNALNFTPNSPESSESTIGNTCGNNDSFVPDLVSSCGPKGRGRPKGSKGTQQRVLKMGEVKKPFSCAICQKSFRQKSTLLQHERIHLNSRPYKCEHCSKEFRQQTHLTQHVRIHTDEKPYPCEHCGRAFRQRTILNQHLRIHTGAKPYECPQCMKCFRQKAILDQHIRTHQGDRPYCCPVARCRKRFTQIVDLNHHLRLHEENPDGGPQPRRGRPVNKKKNSPQAPENVSFNPALYQYMGTPIYPGVPGPMTQLLHAPASPISPPSSSTPPGSAPPAHSQLPSTHQGYPDQGNINS